MPSDKHRVSVGVSGRGGGGGGGVWTGGLFGHHANFLVAGRKKFAKHPDTPVFTLHRYRMVCFSATVQRN